MKFYITKAPFYSSFSLLKEDQVEINHNITRNAGEWCIPVIKGLYQLQRDKQLGWNIPSDFITQYCENLNSSNDYQIKIYEDNTIKLIKKPQLLNINEQIDHCRHYSYEGIKIFIKNEPSSKYGVIETKLLSKEFAREINIQPLKDEISCLIKSMKFADLLFDKEIKPESLEQAITNILPISNAGDTIPSDCYIDILERIENNKNGADVLPTIFYANWNVIKNILPQEFIEKVEEEVIGVGESLPLEENPQLVEDCFMYEVGFMHQLHGISPLSLFAMVNRENVEDFELWTEGDQVKDNSIEFYKDVYSNVPEILIIIDKLEKEENPLFNLKEQEIFNKALVNNLGYYLYKLKYQEMINPGENFKPENIKIIEGLMNELPKPIEKVFDQKFELYNKNRVTVDLIGAKTGLCAEYFNLKIAEKDQQINELKNKVEALSNMFSQFTKFASSKGIDFKPTNISNHNFTMGDSDFNAQDVMMS